MSLTATVKLSRALRSVKVNGVTYTESVKVYWKTHLPSQANPPAKGTVKKSAAGTHKIKFAAPSPNWYYVNVTVEYSNGLPSRAACTDKKTTAVFKAKSAGSSYKTVTAGEVVANKVLVSGLGVVLVFVPAGRVVKILSAVTAIGGFALDLSSALSSGSCPSLKAGQYIWTQASAYKDSKGRVNVTTYARLWNTYASYKNDVNKTAYACMVKNNYIHP